MVYHVSCHSPSESHSQLDEVCRMLPTQTKPSELHGVIHIPKGELFLGRQPGQAVGQVQGVYPYPTHDTSPPMNTHSLHQVCLVACTQ